MSFTVRRPSPLSRGVSSGADSDEPSFKIPALPKHLRNGGPGPGSPLAQGGSAASSPKRSYDSVDSSEEDETQDELISGFDKFGVKRLHEKPKPKGPLVIPALKNRDWRALAKKRKTAQMYVPESGRAAVNGADGTVGGLGTRDTINSGPQAIGLQIKQKKLASELDEADMQEAEAEIKPQVEESEDQLALRALLASAAGEGDEDFASHTTIIPVTEDEAFRQDVEELPDSATLNDYTDMPVSEFGAAMLRGMGWTGDEKGQKNVQPWLPQSRPALLGIGAKEKAVFDDGSKKKLFGKPDRKYIPVVKKERLADSSASSRNRTPSPSGKSSPRRKTRSTSPGRKDGTSRGDARKKDRDDDKGRERDRDAERRRDRDRRKGDDRGGERRRHRDDDEDRRRERDGDGRRDRDRDGHSRDRDSNKREGSKERRERRSERRD
ncbi:DExH-box splicing factor binding site-domain-containing protein [Thelephora terrestris]|uniref:DExH-box splicing factor binding site-domain-containing protein n=1 Tax=Thelephora terrestris TaxID=56493 RepID=A0A9P6H7M3_9AGAM|nr:DExH-box splicing factor binding site-domain-containing protein [Thelephora terrestris]